MNLAISGLASGFDWQTLISQLSEVERAPQRSLLAEQTKLQERNNAFGAVKTGLGVLQNRITALKEATLFDSRKVSSSDTTLGTATVSAGATVGTYTFNVSQLATASKYTGATGATGAGKPLSATDDVSGLALSSAGFATAVTAGTFTVNGRQVTVAATDTLGGLFTKISDATGGAATANYSKDTDQITLSSATPIVLGSATDTSNFLQVAKLTGNNATSLVSSGPLGAVRQSGAMSAANFTTPLTGGSSGEFKINGVSIAYDTTTDSVATVLDRINSSSAGVTASYDAANDRFTVANKSTGSVGIAMEDVGAGNFLAAAGLLGGSLALGDNLLYTVNNGGVLTSQSNTITDASSGLTGLSVTALAEDTFDISVGVDTDRIKSAITGFVDAYNSSQSQIGSYTASTTDAQGKVTAGLLADDPEAANLTDRLRSLATSTLSGLTGSIVRLETLGINSNGYDDALSTTEIADLDSALAQNLAAVKDFFTNEQFGLATRFDDYLESTIGDEGNLTSHQTMLTRQANVITTQVAEMERLVVSEAERLTASFVAMEQAQARNTQQLEFLLKSFGS